MAIHPDLKTDLLHRVVDRAGVAWSGLCAVHCALVPLAFAIMPSLWMALHSHRDPRHGLVMTLVAFGRWEWLVALVAGSIAIASTLWGLRRHGLAFPLVLACSGAALLLLASLVPAIADAPWLHAGTAVLGGAALVAAHVRNLSARHARIA